MTRPTILLVEDELRVRNQLANELQDAGARVLSSATAEDALRQFQRQASRVSALVTDLALNKRSPDPQPGISLANEIRRIEPRLPRFGVTGTSHQDSTGALEEVYVKSRQKSRRTFRENIPRIIERALEFEDRRFAHVPKELVDIRDKYEMAGADFARIVAGWRMADIGEAAFLAWRSEDPQEQYPGIVHLDENCSLKFIPEGRLPSGRAIVVKPIALIVRRRERSVIAELFGLPSVYTYADTDDMAVAEMAEYLFDCRQQIEKSPIADEDSLDLIRFFGFLRGAFSKGGDG